MQDHGRAPQPHITIRIDHDVFHVEQESMTGAELRALPTPPVGADRDLWLDVPGGSDELISDEQSVALSNGQHFFTVPAHINPGRS